MSRALSASRSMFSDVVSARLPLPGQLAGLGTVLCLYRSGSSELGGWRHAVSVAACQGVDSDGIRESLCFHDAGQRCCWRLYLLPDSDFLAWDRLVTGLPIQTEAAPTESTITERLWRRMAGGLGGDGWRMCALRLHATDGGRALAASTASLSSLGAAVARRIARLEGAQGEVWVDDCCCVTAARRSAPHPGIDQSQVIRI